MGCEGQPTGWFRNLMFQYHHKLVSFLTISWYWVSHWTRRSMIQVKYLSGELSDPLISTTFSPGLKEQVYKPTTLYVGSGELEPQSCVANNFNHQALSLAIRFIFYSKVITGYENLREGQSFQSFPKERMYLQEHTWSWNAENGCFRVRFFWFFSIIDTMNLNCQWQQSHSWFIVILWYFPQSD